MLLSTNYVNGIVIEHTSYVGAVGTRDVRADRRSLSQFFRRVSEDFKQGCRDLRHTGFGGGEEEDQRL
jgi:hypothetical protein